MSGFRIYHLGWIVLAILLILLPQFLPEVRTHLATEILIYALFAVSFNLLFGYAGLLPFGHGALFGVGCYGAALVFRHYPGMPLLLTMFIALLSALLAALVIGFFSVRLKGAYFALITASFQMFLFAVAMKWRSLTGGDDGMAFTRSDLHFLGLGSISMRNIQNMYYFTLVIATIGILVCYLFLKTPLGNSVVCVREKDVRASFLGYNIFLTKYIAFLVSGALAGLAGGLYAFFQEFVSTSSIDLNTSISVVFMSVLGGTGHFFGPILGSCFYIAFQDWISSLTKHWWVFMGICFILIVLYLEGGLISLVRIEKIRFLINGWRK